MSRHEDIMVRWRDRVLGATTKGPLRSRRDRVIDTGGDELWSYGSHFILAMPLRDKRGNVTHFLLNGDTFSVSTSRHQGLIRGVLDWGAARDIPKVIIPFTALTAAGIVISSVKPLEITSDTWKETVIHSVDFPAGAKWEYECEQLAGTGLWLKTDGRPANLGSMWSPSRKYERDEDGKIIWDSDYHVDADGDRVEHVAGVVRNTGRKKLVGRSWQHEWDLVWNEAEQRVEYQRIDRRHILGASLIEAEVRYTTRTKCRTCNGTGEVEPYEMRMWSAGESVTRMASFCPEGGCVNGRRVVNRTRRTKFLSGFDENERRPSYFFCELPPKCDATTVDDAYEALKPEAVKIAEAIGREVKRQGDIFTVGTTYTRSELRAMGARFVKQATVFDTNHVATEAALIDGAMFVRGTLRHRPQWRRPDHAMLKLDGYMLAVKNTVPTGRG